MKSEEIRKRFLDFFEERGHAVIPSASLVPEGDSSTLFVTAGMQPLVPYLLGEKHPSGTRLVDVQRCLRTGDIEEVGDNTHLTFFEMLGNWSLGDYFKEDAIAWSYQLLTDEKEGFGLDPNRLYVTIFEGNDDAPLDKESKKIWMSLGVPEHRIYPRGVDDNWWSPGDNGPCGPDSEMFYDVTKEGLGDLSPEEFERADEDQRVVEIWNDVFMEYEKRNGAVIGKLDYKNVDTGSGFERITAVIQKKSNVFETDLFEPIIKVIKENSKIENDTRAVRIIADHIRAVTFMIADGVRPSSSDQGYILRRLLRRARYYYSSIGAGDKKLADLIPTVVSIYKNAYVELGDIENIISVVNEEEIKFLTKLDFGEKIMKKIIKDEGVVSGQNAFLLYATYGYPFELIVDIGKQNKVVVDADDFVERLKRHKEKSQTAAVGKFKGGLADHSEETVRLHTAHHLLLAALQKVLGSDVKQRGSNITPERLRIDFSFDRKLTDEEKEQVQIQANEWIAQGLDVTRKEMKREEAESIGAQMEFGQKYPDIVSVYVIEDADGNAISKEFCGGPHVANTNEIGKLIISSEKASSAGVRRIKAVLQ